MSDKALVIGGGIGGLTAAVALRRAGFRVEVFEAAPVLEERGSGLAIQPNAMQAFRAIGLEDAVARTGHVVTRSAIRDARGRVLHHLPVARETAVVGAPLVTVDRGRLQRVLLDAVGDVRTAKACVGLDQDDAGVTARFADGSEARGDVLVGADGLRSAVRAALHGEEPPRYAGYVAWRGLVDAPDLWEAGDSAEVWGVGLRAGIARVDARQVYWFAVRNAPPGGQDPPEGPRPGLLATFGDFFHPLPALIERTEEVLRHDVLDRPPRRAPWGVGRVTLLGDAAHPMTPNMGQGACQAIEDAVVLARHLASPAPAALRAYEAERARRTAWLVKTSWRLGVVGQWESPLACALRDLLARVVPAAVTRAQVRRAWAFSG